MNPEITNDVFIVGRVLPTLLILLDLFVSIFLSSHYQPFVMVQAFVPATTSPLFFPRSTTHTRRSSSIPCRKHPTCTSSANESINTKTITRRQLLKYSAVMPSIITLFTATKPARADRTGKYSTKLTAKRRYLPRIARGLKELAKASPENTEGWVDSLKPFINLQDDFITALSLFGTTYFAEGNRIGPTERKIAEIVNNVKKDIGKLIAAVKENDKNKAQEAYNAILVATQEYVDIAKIKDSLISFAPK